MLAHPPSLDELRRGKRGRGRGFDFARYQPDTDLAILPINGDAVSLLIYSLNPFFPAIMPPRATDTLIEEDSGRP